MIKITRILVFIMCLMLLTACSAQKVTENSATANTDLGILNDCNPFNGLAFFDGDKVYKAQIDSSQDGLSYILFLKGNNQTQDAISFYSQMVGDNAPESIEQNISYFNEDGQVKISGKLVDCSNRTDVIIGKNDTGYEVKLVNDVLGIYESYMNKLAQNFHNGVIFFDPENTGVEVLYFEFDAQDEFLEVNLEENSIICMRTYQLDGESFNTYEQYFTSASFLEAMGENTDNDPDIIEDSNTNNIQCQQRDIFIGIHLNRDDLTIMLSQSVNAIDKNIGEY